MTKAETREPADANGQALVPNRAGLAHYLLPSISDLIFVLLFFSLAFGALAPRLLWDADIGWHIRNGQNILATHSVPHTDSFSARLTGHPWYAWEWLYDALIAAIYNRLALNGVVFFSALVIAATLAMIFRLALRRGGGLPATVILFLIATVASSIHFLARPHVVGWMMAIAWFWILDSSYRQSLHGKFNRRLYCLPVLMLLWANLHGGFVLAFVLTGIFLFADILLWLKCRTQQRAWAAQHAQSLALVLGLSAAVSLINPYGYKLHVHVYQYLTNRFLMQHIDEFRAPNFHGLPAQFFLLLLLITVLAIVPVKAKMRWAEALLILFAALSGLFAARNIPVASMLLVVVVAPMLALLPSSMPAFLAPMTHMESKLRGHLWPVVMVVVGLALCSRAHAAFDPQRFPVQAVDVLQQRGIREPILSLDSWGGYLIYRLYPQTKVLIDDRHDFYGEPVLRDFLRILHVESGWEKLLQDENVNLVLMPTKSKLTSALANDPGWTLLYQDSVAAAFQRKHP